MNADKMRDGGYLLPGEATWCEPIWNNWIGKLLWRLTGVHRERKETLAQDMLDAFRVERIDGNSD